MISEMPMVTLAGSPNSGKTALFNALTGSRQKVGNYPGVTVEKKEGVAISKSGLRVRVLDLPGLYSLSATSPDEAIASQILLGHQSDEESPAAILAVVDATVLERNLSFILELRDLGRPVVLALNMMDLAKNRGLDLDLKILSKELGLPVIPTVATKKEGLTPLLAEVEKILSNKKIVSNGRIDFTKPTGSQIRARFDEVDRILKLATRTATSPDVWSRRLDSVLLHKLLGPITLITILAVIFQCIFTWATPFMDLIIEGFEALGSLASTTIPEGPIRGLVVEGIIAGAGGVLVFLPQILLLFLFILILEDVGYMARAAFLMDKLMGSVGLHGRAFIPLLSSFACAIPGIMATRTIANPKDRLVTILVSPLMTCSARLPVYALLIAAFIPNTSVWGWFKLQGLVLLGLYIIGIIAAVGVAFLLKKSILRGRKPPFLMDLPSYKVPNPKDVFLGLYQRAKLFVKRVGKVIVALTIILWFLSSYPKPPEAAPGEAMQPPIYYSLAGKMGRAIEPVLRPLGFDWRISIAMIPGFAAREVMVGALATVYAVEGQGEDGEEKALSERVAADWSLATALSLLAWYIFSPQCLSTFAVTRRETETWKWPGVMLAYMLVLAYGAAFVTYQVCSAIFV